MHQNFERFVRSNRLVLANLDAYAHDLFAVLTTGSSITNPGTVIPLKTPVPVAAAKGA